MSGGRRETPAARGIPLTRKQAARRASCSLSHLDRARASEQLDWFTFNKRHVRIWSDDLIDWIKRGMPLLLLVAVLGYGILDVVAHLGFRPARVAFNWIVNADAPLFCDSKGKHHGHSSKGGALLTAPPPIQGARGIIDRPYGTSGTWAVHVYSGVSPRSPANRSADLSRAPPFFSINLCEGSHMRGIAQGHADRVAYRAIRCE